MKLLLFVASPLGVIYAAMRVDWILYLFVAMALGGSAFAILSSLYRHFAAWRLL